MSTDRGKSFSKFFQLLFLVLAFLSPATPNVQVRPADYLTAPQAALVVSPNSTPPNDVNIYNPNSSTPFKLTVNLADGTVSVETELLNPRYTAIYLAIVGINVILSALTKYAKALKQDGAYETVKKIDDDHDDCVSTDPLIKDYMDKINNENLVVSGHDSLWSNLTNTIEQVNLFLNRNMAKVPIEIQEAGRLNLINCFERTDDRLSAWLTEFGSAFSKTIVTEVTGTLSDIRTLKSSVYDSSFNKAEIENIQTRLDTIVIDVDREVDQSLAN